MTSFSIVRTKPLGRLLCERSIVRVAEQAQAMVENRLVWVDGRRPADHRTLVYEHATLTVARSLRDTRAGQKLRCAFRALGLEGELHRRFPAPVAMDIGAQQCGFTRVLVENGMKRIYTLDIGEIHVPADLRKRATILTAPKLNVRHLRAEKVPEPVHLITVDVCTPTLSFLHRLWGCLHQDARVLVMVKPRYEFPALVALENLIRGAGFVPRLLLEAGMMPFWKPSYAQRLGGLIAEASYTRGSITPTNKVSRLRRNFHLFQLGARLSGFHCEKRFVSPFPVAVGWEEFFLLRPDWEILGRWGISPRTQAVTS